MKKTFLHDKKIIYYENLIEDFDLVEKINSIGKTKSISEWSEWTASDSDLKYGKQRTVDLALYNLEDDIEAKQIIKKIFDPIRFCRKDYYLENNLEEHFLPSLIPIRIYNYGTYMGPHVDTENENDPRMPTVSMVFYLNDDYEGGEIEFLNQNIKIKPSANSLIVFPSTQPYTHSSLEIQSGNKYMCPIFLYKNKF